VHCLAGSTQGGQRPNKSFKPSPLRGLAYAVTCTTTFGRYAGRLNSGVRYRTLDLIRSLYQPRTTRFWPYVCVAALVALLGSAVLLTTASAIFGMPAETEVPDVSFGLGAFLGMVVFSPIIETVLLLLLLSFLRRNNVSLGATALIGALTWGGLHALLYPMWFFGTVWGFFVFSSAALAWRGVSFARSFWAAAVPHAMVNTAVFATVIPWGGA